MRHLGNRSFVAVTPILLLTRARHQFTRNFLNTLAHAHIATRTMIRQAHTRVPTPIMLLYFVRHHIPGKITNYPQELRVFFYSLCRMWEASVVISIVNKIDMLARSRNFG